MSSRGLPGFANYLASASDISEALAALYDEAADVDRGAVVALFRIDPRRDLLVERFLAAGNGAERSEIAISFDHLPAQVRKRVASSAGFVDFTEQSGDFMKLLGIPAGEGGSLSMRGLSLDNEMCGVLAVVEPKRRFGGRVLDKLAPAADLFALAYARLQEHDARLEAVRTLEEITRSIHSEYERTVALLEQRLHAAQDSSLDGRPSENSRVRELERALQLALGESRAATQKMTAVDQQVAAAVSKLERAHMELHQQTGIARRHSELIHSVRQRLEGALDSPALYAAIEDLLRSLRNYE